MKPGNVYVPERGDVVQLDFDPQKGHEQSKTRPAIIVSPKKYNEKSQLIICCPITSRIKNYPFEVNIPKNITTFDGNLLHGVILSDQVKSLDWQARNAKYLCKLPRNVVNEVLQKLVLLIT